MPRRTTESLPGLSLGVVCVVAAGLLLAASAVAQPNPPAAGTPAAPATQPGGATTRPNAVYLNGQRMINMIRSHMDELKLRDEQKAKIDAVFDKAIADTKAIEADASTELQAKFPKMMQRIGQLKDDVKNLLDEKQKELFDKAVPFGRGGGAQDVTKRLESAFAKLDLTPEQSEKLAKAGEEFNTKMKELVDQVRANGGGDDARQKIVALGSEYRDKVMGILTDEQKAKLHEMMPPRAGAAGGPGAVHTSPMQPAAPPATQANP